MEKDFTQDTLTETIGILTRREVEARILIPLIHALGEKFGREEVEQVISETIIDIARKQGQELAESMGETVQLILRIRLFIGQKIMPLKCR